MRSLGRSIKKFSADDMLVYAAALSYQLFFSLFPFVIFLLALLGVLNLTSFFDWLIKQSQTVLPGQASGLVENVVSQIRGQAASAALSLGAVLALWSASSAVRLAMHALNVAYGVGDRAAWKKFPLSVLYTVLLAVLLIAAAAMMLIGPQLAGWIAQQVGLGSAFATVWTWARIPVAVVLLVMVAALVYYLFPNTGQPFRVVTPGAVLAVTVWVLASLGFSWYVSNFASYNATYGALAAVIVLLFYFFISAAILLFGAELNAEVYRQAAEEA
ncbi:MAG: ribonuclease BN [Actinobacteria bacterium]|nr:MAG: ribonuclease BN [Actinomycetota bacterium]